MNTYAKVQFLITAWKSQSLSRTDLIRAIAEACLGWPYVWGAAGQKCTPSHRLAYAARSACPEGEAARILKKCPVCSGKQEACSVCKYYPGGPVLDFDCRSFTRWLLAQAGVSLQGAGATSQWDTESNWEEKGPIADLPAGKVCCVFMRDGSSMSHTGMHLGNGEIIHCSGEVKRGKAADRGWTHYAVPRGMDGSPPAPEKPVLRRGASGEYVLQVQEILLKLGYDLSPWGADGKCGKKTEAAVRAFQTKNGLKQDGIVGKETYAALEKAIEDLKPEPQPEPFYTVTIPHVSEKQADVLLQMYPGAKKEREAGT